MKDGKVRNAAGDDWATPKHVYNLLNEEFNFTCDPCPYQWDGNPETDGLLINWGTMNFVNPPYSLKLKTAFVKKAIQEWKDHGNQTVFLIPCSTSTILFHDFIYPNASEVRLVERRIKFSGVNTKGEFVDSVAGMHDSMIVIIGGPGTGRPILGIFKQYKEKQIKLL